MCFSHDVAALAEAVHLHDLCSMVCWHEHMPAYKLLFIHTMLPTPIEAMHNTPRMWLLQCSTAPMQFGAQTPLKLCMRWTHSAFPSAYC
jgi:hypothetical protein